jgi:hypothetical protein
MTYFSRWSPLHDENAHTALTFGFLRHAPVEQALAPWLSEVLGRPVTTTVLTPDNFWPTYRSIVDGSKWTEPELVFDADDGSRLTIVVEAKPGYDQQRREQITREIIDAAHAEESERVACIMVGADLGPLMPVEEWAKHIRDELGSHGLGQVACELRYASWASLGKAASRCAEQAPDWRRYAEDVVEQLRLNVLMGYDGAPALDGLEGGLTLVNAVEAFNLTIGAARQFFLALHTASGFVAAGLRPYGGYHRMMRDGSSEAPTASAAFFETTVLLCLYDKPSWTAGQVVFVAFDLTPGDEPELQAGAGFVSSKGETMVYRWAHADEPEGELQDAALRAAANEGFPYAAVYEPGAEWVYDGEPWLPRQPDADIAWAVAKLETACSVWDAAQLGDSTMSPATSDGESPFV